jgi:leader peptidase (prepilin peptidase) / N-methyltransferase
VVSTVEVKFNAGARMRSLPVVAATLATGAAVAASQSSLAPAVLRTIMVFLLVPCALIDLERRVIPNRITGLGSLGALALGLALDPGAEPRRLLWAALAGGFLLVTALVKPNGMGMGDVKLLGMMGLFLGAPVVVALLVALLGNVGAAAVLARRHGIRAARKTELPFGPYLAVGGIVAAVAGAPILHAYLSLHG